LGHPRDKGFAATAAYDDAEQFRRSITEVVIINDAAKTEAGELVLREKCCVAEFLTA